MKKGVVILCAFILSICLISAIHDISPSSFSVDLGSSFLYEITIDNTAVGQDANITQVTITIPNSFNFVKGSNGTDSSSTFTNTSTNLIWTNLTGYVINGSESKDFWFNAIASTIGNYNITIVTLNDTGSFYSNISVEVEDNTKPLINFIFPTPSHNSILSQSYIPVNITASDNLAIDAMIIYLYNSTNLLNSETSSISPYFTSFTGLDDGTYYLNATVNDTTGNVDVTSTRTIIINTTIGCVADWHCTNWSECMGGIQIRSCVDFNTCGENSTKPAENQSCEFCIPNWNCTEWQPEECPKNETQIRDCVDSNNCDILEEKPAETKSCVYESGANILFIFIVIVIIISIIAIVILIIRLQKRVKSQMNKTNFPLRISSKLL